MADENESKPESEEGSKAEVFEIPYAGEVTIPSSEKPPAAPPDKKIHRRRPLPPVADHRPPEPCEPD